MFSLSVVDHLRLNFRLTLQNYSAHAKAAERFAAAALRVKLAILVLFALATASIVLSLFRPERGYQIAAVVIAAVAFTLQVMAIAYGIEARVHSHRMLAHRLWPICERYRGLLTEIQDGLLDTAAILHRREILSEQVHAIFEQGFGVDQQAFESLRQLPPESNGEPATDAQVDHLIPATRKAG